MSIEKIPLWKTPELTRQSVFDAEEQTALELAGQTAYKMNEVIEFVTGSVADIGEILPYVERIGELETGKVDKVAGKGLSTNDYTNAAVLEVAKIADKVDKDGTKVLSDNNYTDAAALEVAKIADKVDKDGTKVLSDNNYTDAAVLEVAKIADKVDKDGDKVLSDNNYTDAAVLEVAKIADKVDKDGDKVLSTYDFDQVAYDAVFNNPDLKLISEITVSESSINQISINNMGNLTRLRICMLFSTNITANTLNNLRLSLRQSEFGDTMHFYTNEQSMLGMLVPYGRTRNNIVIDIIRNDFVLSGTTRYYYNGLVRYGIEKDAQNEIYVSDVFCVANHILNNVQNINTLIVNMLGDDLFFNVGSKISIYGR